MTIFLVMIMGSLFLSMTLVASGYSINSENLSRLSYLNEQFEGLINACVELALLDLYEDSSTSASGYYEMSGLRECQYRSVNHDGQYEITVTVSSEVHEFSKTMEIMIEVVNRYLKIHSWK